MDSWSDPFVRALFEAYPHWRFLTKVHRSDHGWERLEVHVPLPPGARAERGLIIEPGEEITVHFDGWHEHFDPDCLYRDPYVDAGGLDQAALENLEGVTGAAAALATVRRIVTEAVVVVQYWQGTQWRGSALMVAGGVPPLDGMYGSLRATGPSGFDRITVRSWNGTYDADLERT